MDQSLPDGLSKTVLYAEFFGTCFARGYLNDNTAYIFFNRLRVGERAAAGASLVATVCCPVRG